MVLIDSLAAALEGARAYASAYLERQVGKEKMSVPAAEACLGRLRSCTELEVAGEADLVIEAVFEDLRVKQELFGRLEGVVAEDAVLATNTSCLRVTEVSQRLRYPARFCGMHYFSPAEINPLVELVRRDDTDGGGTLEKARSFLGATGKLVVECKDRNGFAMNRFFCPYTNEAVRCLEEGLGTTAQIDAVAREVLGIPLGPFAVMNIVKPRINLHALQHLAPLGPYYCPAAGLVCVGEANRQ